MTHSLRTRRSRGVLGLLTLCSLVGHDGLQARPLSDSNPASLQSAVANPRGDSTAPSPQVFPPAAPSAVAMEVDPHNRLHSGELLASSAVQQRAAAEPEGSGNTEPSQREGAGEATLGQAVKVFIDSPDSVWYLALAGFSFMLALGLALKEQATWRARIEAKFNALRLANLKDKQEIDQLQTEVRQLAAVLGGISSPAEGSAGIPEGMEQAAVSLQPSGITSGLLPLPGQHGQRSDAAPLLSKEAAHSGQDQAESASREARAFLEAINKEYKAAVQRRDRQALRRIASAELNITIQSEETMARRSLGATTQLQTVQGGGSYLLVRGGAKNWLFPTLQTMEGFNANQPQKGIFTFERQPIAVAELKLPAELKEVDGLWEVVKQGVVIVPS